MTALEIGIVGVPAEKCRDCVDETANAGFPYGSHHDAEWAAVRMGRIARCERHAIKHLTDVLAQVIVEQARLEQSVRNDAAGEAAKAHT